MKVLWVCNIMLPIIAKALGTESSNKEGWLSGLCDTLLARRLENEIELHVAYPIQEGKGETASEREEVSYHKIELPDYGEGAVLYAYGFYEDVNHAEKYDNALEGRLKRVLELAKPDVIHCFGTEFAHTLAVARCCEHPEKVLVGIQGICSVIAKAYMADLPKRIQNKVTFRDWLKQDSIRQQQQKFEIRGRREQEAIALVGNITGRTHFDRYYTGLWNPNARYFTMNETLRACFYEGQWNGEKCESHTIFLSQGDYPLKGLHYLLMAAGELKEQYPDLQIKIAGNSLVNYRTLKDKLKISAYGAYLRELIDENRLGDRVSFLGRLTALEMKEEYLKCGLYVCCSSNENSPNSLGEAMLLGVPCVAADVGGISTIFSDGVDGILYKGFYLEEKEDLILSSGLETEKIEPDESKEQKNGVLESVNESIDCFETEKRLERVVNNLKMAISSIWENEEETQRFCENARKHARITHDSEVNYRKMTEIYAKIARSEK